MVHTRKEIFSIVGMFRERVTAYMYSAKRALRSVNLAGTGASLILPTDGIRTEIVIKRDDGLAIQRRGQVDYLPFWRQVRSEEEAATTGTG